METMMLDDLVVATDDGFRQATAQDCVAALIAEGGEIVEAVKQLHDMKFRWLVATGEPGRYLVYGPIPAEEETTT